MSRPRQPRFTWRSAAFEPDSGLTWRARLAAAVYCEFANVNGALDPAPSIVTLAERMGVATTTAHAARRELEKSGWLSITRRPGRPSRIQLATFGEPLRETQGSSVSTPARTPAPTHARTPAPGVPEPGEPEEPGGPGRAHARAEPPSKNLNSDLRRQAQRGRRSNADVIADAVRRAEEGDG